MKVTLIWLHLLGNSLKNFKASEVQSNEVYENSTILYI